MFLISETADGNFMVSFEEELMGSQKGSYNVMGARILGLPYPEYLRFCRDKYRATLRGKVGYSYPVFKQKKDAENLSKLLNSQYNEIRPKLIAIDFFKKV